jgi:hypothetical protein
MIEVRAQLDRLQADMAVGLSRGALFLGQKVGAFRAEAIK